MGVITSDNADRVGSTIALILTIPAIWVVWQTNIVYLNFSNSLPFYFMAGLFFLLVFLFLRFLIVFIFSWVFDVIPWTYGEYTNDTWGFSAFIPLEFTNMPHLHPPDPSLIIHARDKSGYASITILAGSRVYGQNPCITDIENQEAKAVHTLRGRLESMQRVQIGNIDAVKVIAEVESMKIKKLCMVKDGDDFVIICSAPSEHFSVFDPAFEKCFSTLTWVRKK